MLPSVRLVDQWAEVEAVLPDDWAEGRLVLTVSDADRCSRAAALLAPCTPLRRGNEFRFVTGRAGRAPSPESVRRLLAKLDAEGIEGELELVEVESAPAFVEEAPPPTLVEGWDTELAKLPDDWSDLYCEVELTSSDFLERAALDLAPVNPGSFGDGQGLRFRCARRFGYGAAPGMVRACLARCDRDGIRGGVRILRVLSDTQPVGTQGPVWYVGGRVI